MKAQLTDIPVDSQDVISPVIAKTRRPRVLVLEGTERVGGGQRVTLDIAAALGSEFDFSVVVPGEGALQDELKSFGIESHRVRYPAPTGSFSVLDRIAYLPRGLGSIRRLVSLIRQTNPDLLYATSRTALWAAIAGRMTSTPVAVHLHMIPSTAKTAWFLRRVCAMRSVKVVLVASGAISDRISLPTAKFRVVPNGIDSTFYRSQSGIRDDVRAELGIPASTHLAAVVGELSPEKGQLEAILSVASLVKDGHEVALAIFGSARSVNDQYAAQLRETVASLGLERRVIFTGHRDDVSRLLNGVDLLLVPSRGPSGEACPMVVLEAWATGVPVLASRIGGLPEMIGLERGVLFDPSVQDALAHEWQELIGHPERDRQMSDAGLAAVSDQYSSSAAMARIEQAITEAISA